MLYSPPATAVRPAAHRAWHTLRVLAVGDVDHQEFAAARELMAGDTAADLQVASVIDVERLAPWDLAVVCQSRPGSVRKSLVQRLRHVRPLSGLVLVLGTWCEGEARTGKPLPIAERLFWYQVPAWWQRNVAACCKGQLTTWQQLGPSQTPGRPSLPEGGLVVVDAADFDTADTLLAACEAAGVAALWAPRSRAAAVTTPASAAIWVGRQLSTAEEAELAHFQRALPPTARLVVLLDFPRHDRVQRAMQLGAHAVLGKPWRWEHLATCLTPLR